MACACCAAEALLSTAPPRHLAEARLTNVLLHYLLSAPAAAANATDGAPSQPTAPMVIFVVDTSGSMGLGVSAPDGKSTGLTRLACMQQAVRAQVEALQTQQPECVCVLISFSNR